MQVQHLREALENLLDRLRFDYSVWPELVAAEDQLAFADFLNVAVARRRLVFQPGWRLVHQPVKSISIGLGL